MGKSKFLMGHTELVRWCSGSRGDAKAEEKAQRNSEN
jgi:hypothetical protein